MAVLSQVITLHIQAKPIEMKNYFFYWGKKVLTIKDELVFPAMTFVEIDGDESPVSFDKIFWRFYKKSY